MNQNNALSPGNWPPLAVRRESQGGESHAKVIEKPGPENRTGLAWMVVAIALALGYAPTRLIQEANPEWRLVSWALSIEVIGLTLLVLPQIFPPRNQTGFAFPVFPFLFFLVAVPWPTLIEQPIIQGLTRWTARGTVELLGLYGIPALQRGSVIELGSGLVGIDEACSGIRSFQAALMVALFFGQVYRLAPLWRVAGVIVGLGLALLFNLLRTTLLAILAAGGGAPLLARWHDRAGVSLLLSCFVCIWLLARRFGRSGLRVRPFGDRDRWCGAGLTFPEFVSPGAWAGWLLVGWILIVEVGTEAWYRHHEHRHESAVLWHPTVNHSWPGFCQSGFDEAGRRLLRFDEALNASWEQPNGWRWQLIFLRWAPGKIATQLARNHTPEDCLPAAGHQLVAASDLAQVTVRGVKMPFRYYAARQENTLIYVFYCLWEDGATEQTFGPEWLTYRNRLRPVLAGRRNCGQRSLELALWGPASRDEAQQALGDLLPQIIQFEN